MRRLLAAPTLLVVWSIPGLLSAAATIVLFPRSPTLGGSPGAYLLVAVASWWVWAPLTPAIVALARRVGVDRARLGRTIVIHTFAMLAATGAWVLWSAAASTGVRQWLGNRTVVASQPGVLMRPAAARSESLLVSARGYVASRLPTALVVYATIVGMAIAYDERSRRRMRELQSVGLSRDLARAQLQALQMQLQPHFLFNTLHAVSLLVEQDPPAASRMITRLGDLLRTTLRLADVPEITLGQELDLLREYLGIEEMRYRDRLAVSIDAPADVLHLMVPCFILQPLVENAVRHGVGPRLDPGRIAVRARRDANVLSLSVEDDGPGFGDEPRRTGVGLRTTIERLFVRYGEAAALRFDPVSPTGTRVTLELPIQHA
jgi:two-component system, LytTR family, sensor kinase